MAGTENRPFVGTWKGRNRTVVKYTPDALVFINGDSSLPGCPRCRGRIDIQKFVTSMSIEAGVAPGAHSASVQLSLPRVQGQQVFIDGNNILRVGLEIHIFMRGYFPVRGMFAHLPNPDSKPADPEGEINSGTQQANALESINFPNAAGGNRLDMSKYATYPYYPVFHGVVTQVNYDYSDGFYTGSLSCASLLHFWQYQNITTSGAFLAKNKPTNDPGRTTLFGHNFNNMHPFAIIYTLYRDIAGAAMGVDFALGEATNLDAVDASTGAGQGRQLFDSVAIYWEQRFKTRIQELRMYGVNGSLFNAAQQAWLGSASNRDVKRLLPSPTYNDPETTRTEQDPFSSRQSVAKALGLQNSGADFVYSPLLQQDGEVFNLSVLDMFAFNQSIAEIGQVNKWVSTYQTKMDIANSVTEVTGYELYQDVDGDLVFKPPFYNLDTSTNRFYRLEDQDIISISFVEKEPTATFVQVKGVWVEGFTDGTTTNNEMLKRGLYVDYKLVAKFGWRQGASMELTYVTDPKVCFWIAVARLDMLNVDTFSASCSIPIRPEMRPGYPVYIPFADCYYYVTQLSHQFAFGGQCTTNLTLTCRRTKWHAPGFLENPGEGKSAIDLIRLDRPDLPPRPLEVYVNGFARLVGFPNVVMALDPREMDPNFSLVGVGIDFFDKTSSPADDLMNWLRRDVNSLNAFEPVFQEVEGDGKAVEKNLSKVDRFKIVSGPNAGVTFTLEDLRSAFTTRRTSREGLLKTQEAGKQANYDSEVARGAESQLELGKSLGTERPLPATDREAKDNALAANQATEFAQKQYLDTVDQSLLQAIFDALQPQANKPVRRKIDGIAGSDVTLSWFQSLSHLKGQYMADTLPGNYRYFSCAHPTESMQGMPIIEWSDGENPPSSTPDTTPRQAPSGTQTPAIPVSGSTDQKRRFTEERASLQADLASRGVTWVDARKMLANRDAGRTTAKIPKEQVQNASLTKSIKTNLANIGQATQILFNNLQARADWRAGGWTIVQSNSWRVDSSVEGSDKESQHALGKAMDIGVGGGNIVQQKYQDGTKLENLDPSLRAGYLILKDEASKAWAEGVFNGYGFYEERRASSSGSGNGPFVHVDVRTTKSSWAEKQGAATYDTNKKLSANCGGDKACIEGLKIERARAKELLKQQNARALQLAGVSSKKRLKSYPLGKLPDAAPAPASAPPPTTTGSGQVALAPPTVKTTELSLEIPRTVIQFTTTPSLPEGAPKGTRAPEAQLVLGKCTKGLQIALGPQRTPRLITTDQIQSISFVRHKANKDTALVGTSQTSGRNSFKGVSTLDMFQKQLAKAANQIVSTGTETVADAFAEKYNEIGTQILGVEFPIYDNGKFDKNDTLEIDEFVDVGVIPIQTVASDGTIVTNISEGTLQQLGFLQPGQTLGTENEDLEIDLLTFDQIISIKGYKPQGSQTDTANGKYQRAINNLATLYAQSITKEIEDTFTAVQALAMEPATDRKERIAAVAEAFGTMMGKSSEPEGVFAVVKNAVVDFASKLGKKESPVHTPVFPVSDEKGYEHYGAYRYGRGLTVETGGTFEFIHSGQDPFKNVTAQTAEEFLKILTLQQQGRISTPANLIAGFQDAAVRIAKTLFGVKQEPLENTPEEQQQTTAEDLGVQARNQEEVNVALKNLSGVIAALQTTAEGRDILRALLTANGDDPNLIDQEGFNYGDTQFTRNFVNFAVNYGKSDVFKTTVSNAAWQLADLTSHLHNRAGQMCSCRGSFADITLSAYTRDNFVGVDEESGLSRESKAAAFQVETIRSKLSSWRIQQQQYRGAITQGKQPDAKAQQNSGGVQGISLGGANPSNPRVPGADDAGTVSAENPPTTANPDDLPITEVSFDEGLTVPPGDVSELNGDPVLIGALEDMTGLSAEEMQEALNSGDPAALAALEEGTGFSGAELQALLAGAQPPPVEGTGSTEGAATGGINLGDPTGATPQEVANEIGAGATPDQVRNLLLRGTPEQIAGLEAETGLTHSELLLIFGFGG